VPEPAGIEGAREDLPDQDPSPKGQEGETNGLGDDERVHDFLLAWTVLVFPIRCVPVIPLNKKGGAPKGPLTQIGDWLRGLDLAGLCPLRLGLGLVLDEGVEPFIGLGDHSPDRHFLDGRGDGLLARLEGEPVEPHGLVVAFLGGIGLLGSGQGLVQLRGQAPEEARLRLREPRPARPAEGDVGLGGPVDPPDGDQGGLDPSPGLVVQQQPDGDDHAHDEAPEVQIGVLD